MDSKSKIKFYVLLDDTHVVQAFTVKLSILFDKNDVRMKRPLSWRHYVPTAMPKNSCFELRAKLLIPGAWRLSMKH